tara:strand:- start:9784 stop:11841 length:2058 start_codon:yes stop_codon:yes gene_type:complete
MSLVITGNKLTESGVRDIGIAQAPYHYRNFLKETITLSPDSEVAVQSVKLTKSNSIRISPNDGFYTMFNIDLAKLDDGRTTANTVGSPIWCQMGDGEKSEDVSLIQFQERLSQAMKKGTPHPNVYGVPSASSNNPIYYPQAEREYNETTGAFQGYDLQYLQTTENDEDLNNVSSMTTAQKWFVDDDQTLSWNASTGLITSPVITSADHDPIIDNQIALINHPISLSKGNMRMDLDGVMADYDGGDYTMTETEWAFGLVRSKAQDDAYVDTILFGPADGNMPTTDNETVAESAGNSQYFDYVVRSTRDANGNYFLRLGNSSVNGDNDKRELGMREIEYYGWASPKLGQIPVFSTAYNLTTNTLNIKQFLIRVENEIVKFYYNDYPARSTSDDPLDDTGWVEFCSQSIASWEEAPATNYKKAYPKPLGQTMWWSYPKFYIENYDEVKDLGYSMNLSAFSGRVNSLISSPWNNIECDWTSRMLKENTYDVVDEIDTRYMYNDTLTETYSYNGIQTSITNITMKNYIFALIILEDKKFYPNTSRADDSFFGRKVGFPNISILRPDINGVQFSGTYGIGWSYTSAVIPELLSSGSLFIRLDNFSQKTLNASVGRPSKILYTIPQFDTTGGQEGLLYFEPNNRVYTSLSNPAPLTINTFDISICDENEVLAENLQDQTIIVLHFRDKVKMN